MLVSIYQQASLGRSMTETAKTLGVGHDTFLKWKKEKSYVKDAWDRGREVLTAEPDFPSYVYNRLPENLQQLWDQIDEVDTKKNAQEMIERLLQGHPTQVRQHLFLYAWTSSDFSLSEAVKKVNINMTTLNNWKRDPEFAELVDEIHWHKKNYFERAFIGRVASGDTAAIIHAVKSQCADRGYNPSMQVDVAGKIEHQHDFNVEDIMDELSLSARREILNVMDTQISLVNQKALSAPMEKR